MTKRNVPLTLAPAAEQRHRLPSLGRGGRPLLLIAFAFTVMADPISSVAYAIEAALRALDGNLALLLPTMALVIVMIGIVAYFPLLAPVRVLVALGLLLLVAGLTWFGHAGRTVFAALTLAFVGTGIALLVSGVLPVPHHEPAGLTPLLFALFQLTTTLLLLSAASSSFQAGPGLLKALARHPGTAGQEPTGMLPAWMGRINRHYTPYWGVVLYLLIAAAVVVAVNAQDQELVLF
jgi:hypothetical protein